MNFFFLHSDLCSETFELRLNEECLLMSEPSKVHSLKSAKTSHFLSCFLGTYWKPSLLCALLVS